MEDQLEIRCVTFKGREFEVREDGKCWYAARVTARGYRMPRREVGFSPANKGYMRCDFALNGVRLTASQHELVALAFIGPRPNGSQIDHVNGVKSDNPASNLRYDSGSGNCRSFAKKKDGSSSKYRGVCQKKSSGKWVAKAYGPNGERVQIGTFADERDAARAFDAYAERNEYDEQALNRTHFKDLSVAS